MEVLELTSVLGIHTITDGVPALWMRRRKLERADAGLCPESCASVIVGTCDATGNEW
jgi:hypothetical protein